MWQMKISLRHERRGKENKQTVMNKQPMHAYHGAAGQIVRRVLCVLLVTLLLLCGFLYGVMYVVCRGPSPTARNLFVLSVRETSAIGFLARLYFSEEEIAAIEARQTEAVEASDASLITVAQRGADEEPTADDWGYIDEDGDGLILVPVSGESYNGFMLIVLDPRRVTLGFSPEDLGTRGYTVAQFGEKYGAVAAINGGGFYDPGGMGNGSIPEHVVVKDGVIYCAEQGMGNDFSGLDEQGILHVGLRSLEEIQNRHILQGCGYGPVLVVNGLPTSDETLTSGLNPRTAIGQRSDGAILLLVIDGRRATSLGASYRDVAEQMLAFGAVNATNLDGGSSSLMWMDGEYLNNTAAVIGVREIPTAFLVMPEEEP